MNDQRPSECKHYENGNCKYDKCNPHRCCMEVVKPTAMCFDYDPKELNEGNFAKNENKDGKRRI